MPPSYRQQPTLQNTRIRSTQDALHVFYGVARNVLTLLSRRLDAEERKFIRPGNVYVWEDRTASTAETTGLSMERWTDGISWGPSRIRDEFLFYYQRDPQTNEHPNNPGGPPAPLQESERLIKQTYSVFVSLPEDRPHDIVRKWHLTAYFNQAIADQLQHIKDIHNVGRMPIPEDLFRSARAVKGRRDDPRRTPLGQLMGPPSDQGTPPPNGAPLYTIFPSVAQPLPTQHQHQHPHPHPQQHHSHYPVAVPPPTPALVPLQQLEAISRTGSAWRDPADQQLLQQFSARRPSGSPPDRLASGSPAAGEYALPPVPAPPRGSAPRY